MPPPDAPRAAAPAVVSQHFRALGIEIVAATGRGRSAIVYRGRQGSSSRDLAIKILLRPLESQPMQQLLAQWEAAKQIDHPALLRPLRHGILEGRPYVITEHLEGGSLEQRAASKPVPLATALALLHELADGVQALHHRGLVHGDLRPRNILFHRDGTAKLVDFGLAAFVPGQEEYCPPEGEISAAADLLALGVILEELLYGRPPQPPTSKIPKRVTALIQRCRAADPQERPQSAGEFLELLESASPANNSTGVPLWMYAVGGSVAGLLILAGMAWTMRSKPAVEVAQPAVATTPVAAVVTPPAAVPAPGASAVTAPVPANPNPAATRTAPVPTARITLPQAAEYVGQTVTLEMTVDHGKRTASSIFLNAKADYREEGNVGIGLSLADEEKFLALGIDPEKGLAGKTIEATGTLQVNRNAPNTYLIFVRSPELLKVLR